MSEHQHLLARVLVSLLKTHDEDKARAARRLHDDVAQVLSAVGLRIGILRMDLEARAPDVLPQLIECQKMLERAMDRVRSLSFDLDPAMVERVGLTPALERLAGRYLESFPGKIQVSVESSVKLPAHLVRPVYRIVEAALTNAVSHSAGSRIEVRVWRQPDGVHAQVSDDGLGFDPAEKRRNPLSTGLLLMQFYAQEYSMTLDISSKLGQGTAVTVQCGSV
jgi:two-component system sensor histidine kinase UhpB